MVIIEVAPDSPAAERELRPGDVIVEVQQERVTTPAGGAGAHGARCAGRTARPRCC